MRSKGILFVVFCIVTWCFTLVASRQGRIRWSLRRISVDEGFAISSGLLDLVVVFVNDVEEHRLEEQEWRRREKTHHQSRSGAREVLGGGEAGGGLLLAGIFLCQTPPFIITCASSLIRSIKHGRDNSKGVGCIRMWVCAEQRWDKSWLMDGRRSAIN